MGNIFSAIAFVLGFIFFIGTINFMWPYIQAMNPVTVHSAISDETYVQGWIFLIVTPLLMCAGIIDYFTHRKYPSKQKAIEQKRQSEHNTKDDDAMRILRVRYVKGEITKEEYDQKKKDLQEEN